MVGLEPNWKLDRKIRAYVKRQVLAIHHCAAVDDEGWELLKTMNCLVLEVIASVMVVKLKRVFS